jgi:hypothetical protein
MTYVEKPAKTQTSIRLASHLVRAPNSWSGWHEFESFAFKELGALTKVEEPLGQVFQQWWPQRDQVMRDMCSTHSADWHVTGRLTCPTPQTADNAFLLNQARIQYQHGTGGSTVEKPAETQTSIRLASHFVWAPNSWSGGHEFEYPA